MAVIIDKKQYITTSEILEMVGVSRQTLWRWRQEGKIPAGHRYRGRQVVFNSEEVTVIQEYANRIEPIDTSEVGQLSLFSSNGTGHKK
jgi:excisionase family DNA binding protein